MTVITTPIFYVNARPHLGHAYSMVLADVIARCNHYTLATGTDEHGLKVWRASVTAGVSPPDWVDRMSASFKELVRLLGIDCQRFMRTTDPEHRAQVVELWNRIKASGSLHLGEHAGWYCPVDERFVPHKELPVDVGKLEFVRELNWKFKLSDYIHRIRDWHRRDSPVVPAGRLNDLASYLGDCDEQELSVSRPAASMHWGIPVPGDPSQLIYVWLDALSNYLLHASTDPLVHVIGKDILKFHAIYWPAFLMAAGLKDRLPKRIIVHGHWLANGVKMSKSLANVVDPKVIIQRHSADPLRWYLIRHSRISADEDFDAAEMVAAYNTDLVNGLGNLLSRVTSPKLRVRGDNHAVDHELIQGCLQLATTARKHYSNLEFQSGILSLLAGIGLCNKFVSAHKPWAMTDASLVKNTTLRCVQDHILPLLKPIIPHTATQIERALLQSPSHACINMIPRIVAGVDEHAKVLL